MTSLIIFYINLLSLFLSDKCVLFDKNVTKHILQDDKMSHKCALILWLIAANCRRDGDHKSISRHLIYTTHFRLTRMTSHGKRRSWSTDLYNDMDAFLREIRVIWHLDDIASVYLTSFECCSCLVWYL